MSVRCVYLLKKSSVVHRMNGLIMEGAILLERLQNGYFKKVDERIQV